MKSPLSHFIVACVAIIVAISGYCILYSIVASASASVAVLQSQIEAKTETAGRIASARAAISEIAVDEATVQNYFVPETGVVAFINGLEAQGKSQGTTVNVLSVSSGTTGTRPTLVLSLIIKGPFDAIMRTIGAIEYAPYDLSISGLSLGQDAKNDWHADLGLVVGAVGSTTIIKTP
ncbi:MAG: hypothetical protein NTU85_00310 [Candidatus Kaiserbacteria bacterium]|nr:hypothetical protein [Candidatus Kaiserbacteria bacterium]